MSDTLTHVRNSAMLLLGPTASGKTPLGRLLESRGLHGRRCLHFDFGENLRQVVQIAHSDGFVSAADIAYLRDVLDRGALLRDEDFPIARRIFERFLAHHDADQTTWFVLNGLPRHRGQARDMAGLLDVQLVVYLQCSAETVRERVARNTGGDRTHRTDDDLDAIQRKLAIFQRETEPLVDFYRERGAEVAILEVNDTTTAELMWDSLFCALPHGGGRSSYAGAVRVVTSSETGDNPAGKRVSPD